MAFQESAMSLKARMHIGEIHPAAILGVVVIGIGIMIVAIWGCVRIAFSDNFEIEHASGLSQDATFQDTSQSDSTASDDGAATDAALYAPIDEVCVYVTGCVVSPGICYLPEGSRVADAVEAAGGFSEDAAADSINLARVIIDGEQIVVASFEEIAARNGEGNSAIAGSADSSSTDNASSSQGKININTADIAQLVTLNGIGEATAEKIIADREANGLFKSIEDIKRVSGIGDKKFEAIKDSICVQ